MRDAGLRAHSCVIAVGAENEVEDALEVVCGIKGHFDRALFAAAALIEELPADELLRFIDVPACKADFYFIEKCALALRARAR